SSPRPAQSWSILPTPRRPRAQDARVGMGTLGDHGRCAILSVTLVRKAAVASVDTSARKLPNLCCSAARHESEGLNAKVRSIHERASVNEKRLSKASASESLIASSEKSALKVRSTHALISWRYSSRA